MGGGTRVGRVPSEGGVGHALPSSNMFDDLLLGIKSSILTTLYPLQLLYLTFIDLTFDEIRGLP